MPSVIVLLTDFGHQDPYVGQMKGSILRHAPEAVLVDLCHEIRPHDTRQAAFMLEASHAHFPDQAIFVCVVDPGVGTNRDLLLARWREHWFLAPDNGLLDFLHAHPAAWWKLPPPPSGSSQTFHGRDIFAPAAARLALGESPDVLGRRAHPADPGSQKSSRAARLDSETIACRVGHVDHFGNCLLDLPIQPLLRHWRLPHGQEVDLAATYAEIAPGRIGLIAGSQGVMELAMNQQSCARCIGLSPGDIITLTRRTPQEHP